MGQAARSCDRSTGESEPRHQGGGAVAQTHAQAGKAELKMSAVEVGEFDCCNFKIELERKDFFKIQILICLRLCSYTFCS